MADEQNYPPVVTPGAAGSAPQGNTSDLLSMLRSRLAESYGERPSGQQQISDFLMNMGTRLMASRAPGPQAFGEAVRGAYDQQQTNQRQQLQDMSKLLENESSARYREAQVRLEEAKQRWAQDPNNPQSIYQLAHAKQAEASARNQLAQASTAGQGRYGSPMVIVNRETGDQQLFYPRPGEQPPPGFAFQRSVYEEERIDARHRIDAARLAQAEIEKEAQRDPRLTGPAADARRRQLEQQILDRLRTQRDRPQGGNAANTQPPQPSSPITVLDLNGRPIQAPQ